MTAVDPADAAAYRAAGWWGDETVATCVARNRAARPEGTAFVDERGRLSWEGYDTASIALASALAEVGVAPGDRAAVLLPDGATVHVAFLAAEKVGATVVGIGARAGDREVRHLLDRTGAGTIVTPASLKGRDMTQVVSGLGVGRHVVVPDVLAGAGPSEVVVDGRRIALRSEDAAVAVAGDRTLGPDDVFMLNSTSGTTGLPKIVVHTENRWSYFHQKAVDAGRLTADDVFLSLLPAPFGFGLWTAHFTPAILGASCVLLEQFTPAAGLDLIEREHVSVMCCVSTQFLMLLEDPSFSRRDLSSLRCMFTGGEAVPYDRAAAFEDATGAAVLQFYGSNETGALSGTTLNDDREVRLRTAGA